VTEELRPHLVQVSERDLIDLRRRVQETRWAPDAPVPGWEQGPPPGWMKELCHHWVTGYDWRQCEARINGTPQILTTIDGVNVHALVRRSSRPDAIPLLLTHGWPGSVVEFIEVIDVLAEPRSAEDLAFHVVAPSLPGFGFSAVPDEPGWGPERVADAWAVLMDRLGYQRFITQGGDWGSFVSTHLAVRHPERLIGVHLNMVIVPPLSESDLTTQEAIALERAAEQQRVGRGYSAIQSTRPQALGYGLDDSPVALCAWIVDKLWSWTDHDGDLFQALAPDQILDLVSTYWLTRTGTSAARIYWESVQTLPSTSMYRQARRVDVPSAVSIFPAEVSRPSRRWCEPWFPDLRFYGEPERGGHFAAYEQPELFVDQVRCGVQAILD